MDKQLNTVAAKILNKLSPEQIEQIKLYHASEKREGAGIGHFLGFVEQPVRDAVLTHLGVHACDR